MDKNILIPSDFSRNSWNAIKYVMDLYRDVPAHFFLVHVYKLEFTSRGDLMKGDENSFTLNAEKEKSLSGLDTIKDKMKNYSTNEQHHFHTISVMDDIISALKSIIKKENITMVAMGTKGATNFEKKAFGSNAINAMENITDCPILAIPMDSDASNFSEIVFPTDYKATYRETDLAYLKDIASLTGANICILTVSNEKGLLKDQQENKTILEGLLSSVNHSYHIVGGHDPNEVVRIFAESRESSLVCFINRKHTMLSRLFHKPMSEELGMFSAVPLLVLPYAK